MIRPIDLYFLEKDEPIRSCLQVLREYFLEKENIVEKWQYEMPFYYYKGKRCCYLWIHKKLEQPYIGFVDGALINNPYLIQENRKRMKILLIDPTVDIQIGLIDEIFNEYVKALLPEEHR